MSKYICPECKGRLEFWEEHVYEEIQRINKETGKLNKRIEKSHSISVGTNGIRCIECNFSISGSCPEANLKEHVEFAEMIFDRILQI